MGYQEVQGLGLNNLYSPFMSSVTLSKSMQIDSVVGKLKKQKLATKQNQKQLISGSYRMSPNQHPRHWPACPLISLLRTTLFADKESLGWKVRLLCFKQILPLYPLGYRGQIADLTLSSRSSIKCSSKVLPYS